MRIVGRGPDLRTARRLTDARATEFRERFGEHLFSDRDETVEQALGRLLSATRRKVALAESCTGGMAAGLLTRVPGVSESFVEGFVTYSNRAKRERLGVPARVLRKHGAVSGEVASALAEGAARVSGASLAASVTGVAGPGGGSDEKPVGLVWFGVYDRGRTHAVERRFPPQGRDQVREYAARTALMLLVRALERGRA